MSEKPVCKDCGCMCEGCAHDGIRTWSSIDAVKPRFETLHLHQEIESLKRKLMEREYYILQMETSVFKHAQQFPRGEWEHLKNELFTWKDKYERLYDSHKKLQKVNQGLEDKLLKLVDKFETEKSSLNRDIADLTTRLVEERLLINDLEEQNDQFRSDCNIAIQLLQCKPSNFIAQKLSDFPSDVQERVRLHFAHQQPKELHGSKSSPELRTIRVPIPTFPPTAMVYSVNAVPCTPSDSEQSPNSASSSSSPDYVSAAILAKVLEERTKERLSKKEPCHACWFRRHSLDYQDKATQTRCASASIPCHCNGGIPIKVHTRNRSGSSSSSSNGELQVVKVCNGLHSSTETTI